MTRISRAMFMFQIKIVEIRKKKPTIPKKLRELRPRKIFLIFKSFFILNLKLILSKCQGTIDQAISQKKKKKTEWPNTKMS